MAATELALSSPARLNCFYDLDTPVTLARLAAGESVGYIGPRGLGDFDLVLSYTGGAALDALRTRLGARRAAPLYGSVDPEAHRAERPQPQYLADLSYLGTYAEDRQTALETLFIEPARRLRERRSVIGGAQYPSVFPWTSNIHFVRHLPPADHPAFFSSSRLTLNVTRRSMAAMGFCLSGRMFEAAACGAPMVSGWWAGLDGFFDPGAEIIVAHDTEDAIAAIELPEASALRSPAARASARSTSTRRSGAPASDMITRACILGASGSRSIQRRGGGVALSAPSPSSTSAVVPAACAASSKGASRSTERRGRIIRRVAGRQRRGRNRRLVWLMKHEPGPGQARDYVLARFIADRSPEPRR